MTKFVVVAVAAFCAACAAQAQTPPQAASTAASAAARAEITGPVLRVTDIERSLRFYVEGLGLAVSRRVANGNVILTGEGKAPAPFIMLIPQPGATGTPPLQIGNGLSRIFLLTADVAGLRARLEAAGYKPGPISAGSGVFFVDDPDGYHYEITGGAASRQPGPPTRP